MTDFCNIFTCAILLTAPQYMHVDLVYLWVDGNDPEWRKKKQLFTNSVADNSEVNNIGRYTNNDELRYSLRSVEKYAPWIRKIFIVTDSQVPAWLNTEHPKVEVIDHTDIIPAEILPTFNSTVIEYFLYKIPGLSEHFLFANDDMFFNAALSADFFFLNDYPIVRLKRKRMGKWHYELNKLFGKQYGQYRDKIQLGAIAVDKLLGKYYSGIPHHNIDAYRKEDYRKAVEEIFSDRVRESYQNRIRTFGDIHRSAFSYYALAVGHAHLRHVRRSEAMRITINRNDLMKYLTAHNPKLFCLNDNEDVVPNDRKRVAPFLQQLFPDKSAFEK